jgi:hypothetical protein
MKSRWKVMMRDYVSSIDHAFFRGDLLNDLVEALCPDDEQ